MEEENSIEMQDMKVKQIGQSCRGEGDVKYTKSSKSKYSPSRIMNSTNFIVSLGCLSLSLLLSQTHGKPVTSSSSLASSHTKHGFLRLQPELDKIDIDSYLKNTKALKLQVNCLIFDGACDWVGRWLKPRAAAALLGECLVCTEHQKTQMSKIMGFIQVNFPDEFKLGIKKYLFEYGIDVPSEVATNTTTTTTTTTTTEMPGSQSLASTSSSTTSASSSDYPPISSLNLKAEPSTAATLKAQEQELGQVEKEVGKGDKVKVKVQAQDKQKKEPESQSSDQTVAKVTVAETTISSVFSLE